MKSKIRKLRHISVDELHVRGSQALAAFLERRGWSDRTKLIADDSFFRLLEPEQYKEQIRSAAQWRDSFSRRTTPHFFPAFTDPEATIAELRRRWPQSEKEIIDHADRIVGGRFDLLAYHNLSFGDPIDWQLEPVANKRAPLVHWSRLNYLDPDLLGDKKITWELNRHQHLVRLGQAYRLTGEKRYAETFAAHLNSWMDQNPPKLGVNWASSLEVSFRSISWLWALYFFKGSDTLTPEIFLRIAKFLYLNARHIETYLSTYFSPNTHLTGEALGLFYIGTFFPEFRESTRWRNTGLQILMEQLGRHVQPDGVYFEQSSYYHRYTTDFYLHLWILLNVNGDAIPDELNQKLLLLLDHLMYITRPDGTTPLFGDDDGGRLLKLDHRASNDFRSTLATGAAVFRRPDYKFVSGGVAEETLWLLGPAWLADLDQTKAVEPKKQSVAFETGGYYVMRDGWSRESSYMLFDCGPHGTDNCGHAHADALAIDVVANGQTFLVDPGTYTYTGSSEMRDWFRGSAAHNTVTIDDQSSSVAAGPFSWKTIARSRRTEWIVQERFDYIVASHDGYSRLPSPAIHTRAILFLKKDYWVLRDHVDSRGEHQVRAWFHFDSSIVPLHTRENKIRGSCQNSDPAALHIAAFAPGGDWSKESGWVSHCYGERVGVPVFAFSVLVNGSEELVTFLLPETSGAGSKPLVREIETLHGRAFEVNIAGKHDILMLRSLNTEAGKVETVRLASDFELTWARFENERARTPEELVLIGGRTLELEGRGLLKSTKRINYLAAGQFGEGYRVETDEGVLELGMPVFDLESLFASFK